MLIKICNYCYVFYKVKTSEIIGNFNWPPRELLIGHRQIDIVNIKTLLESGYYSDKTKAAGKLLIEKKPSSLIRPRRFGKSSFVDTLAVIAEGEVNRELFKGTFIYDRVFTDEKGGTIKYDWKKYPVIRLDFSEVSKETTDLLKIDIKKRLYSIANHYGIAPNMKAPDSDESLESYYISLFEKLQSLGSNVESKVVVLIDKYDAPIVNLECDSDLHKSNKQLLEDFFTVIKGRSKDCQLIFVTGVTKFSLSGLCSGAKNLHDISMLESFSDIVGYQEEEIKDLFQDRFSTISNTWKRRKMENYTQEDIMNAIRAYYNGYRFSLEGKSIYNPSSLLSFFEEGNLKNHWYRKGDPTILLNQVRKNIDRFNMNWNGQVFEATEDQLMVTTNNKEIDLIPLMYQTGYLTLNGQYNPNSEKFGLKFPNTEIKKSLASNLESLINNQEKEDDKTYSSVIKEALRDGEWGCFLTMLRDYCFASSSYEFIKNEEKSFQGLLHSFLNGAFLNGNDMVVSVEEQVGNSRIDLVIHDRSIGGESITYILELKRNRNSQNALDQIQRRGYMRKYTKSKRIVCFGMNFVFDDNKNADQRDDSHRNINECKVLVSDKSGTRHDFDNANHLSYIIKNSDFVKEINRGRETHRG